VISRNKSPEVRKLDDLCRQYVFMRDRFLCVKCLHLTKRRNGDRLQWAHYRTSRIKSLRWMPFNSMVLCHDCHQEFHSSTGKITFRQWFLERYPERVEAVLIAQHNTGHPNMEDIRAMLVELIKKAGG
jgi:5-methylcytosine-specific restriction endonuclease McrA